LPFYSYTSLIGSNSFVIHDMFRIQNVFMEFCKVWNYLCGTVAAIIFFECIDYVMFA